MKTLDELEQKIAKGGGTAMEIFNEQDVPEEERRFVPKQTVDKLMEEKSALEDVIKQKEKRMLRLQQVRSLTVNTYHEGGTITPFPPFLQVFTAKSAEFREAVESLLGIKLAFYPNGTVRITSIFDLGASFIFKPEAPSGEVDSLMRMRLVAQGPGGPQDLQQLMDYWVVQKMCIPGFLAALTLECYEQSNSGRIAEEG